MASSMLRSAKNLVRSSSVMSFLKEIYSHAHSHKAILTTAFLSSKSPFQIGFTKEMSTAEPKAAKDWVTVTYEKPDGSRVTVKGKEGDNLLDIATNNSVDIDGFGACEGTLACSTCHLVFNKDDFDKLPEKATDEELDMLDLAYGLTETPVCVSLAACGFLGVYLAGAMKGLLEVHPNLVQKVVVAGSSAGALLGAGVVCGSAPDVYKDSVVRIAEAARKLKLGPLTPGFPVVDLLRQELESSLPQDAHLRASGRLFVSVTLVKKGNEKTNVILSRWDSREDLIQSLLCSSFIPGFSGLHLPLYKGEKYIDGGFTNRQPGVSTKRNVTVSPYSGSDISPTENSEYKRIVVRNQSLDLSPSNAHRLYHTIMPPSTDVLESYFNNGYKDAMIFLSSLEKREGKDLFK